MSLLFADVDEMYTIADRIAQHASAARATADRLSGAVDAAGWRGTAATYFELSAHVALADMRAGANRLDDAADALRRHAGNVAHVIAALGSLLHDTQALGGDLLRTLGDSVLDPGHLADDIGNCLGDAAQAASTVDYLVGIG